MITTAWASGGSSVRLISRRARIPAGVIASSRARAPPVKRIPGWPEGWLTTPRSRQKTPFLKAGAERLGSGFLGGEAARIARPAGQAAAIAAPPLVLGEDAVEEALAKAGDRLLDPANVDEIAADTEDHLRPTYVSPLPGLDPGIHVFLPAESGIGKDVGGRVKPGHGGHGGDHGHLSASRARARPS